MSYPEGWAQKHAAGHDVTFQDKNNLVRVAIASGGRRRPRRAVNAQLAKLKATNPTLKVGRAAARSALKAGKAVKVTYTTQSAPNPVTGKR